MYRLGEVVAETRTTLAADAYQRGDFSAEDLSSTLKKFAADVYLTEAIALLEPSGPKKLQLVREIASNHPRENFILKNLQLRDDRQLAKHEALPEMVYRRLFGMRDPHILLRLAGNPTIPAGHIEELATGAWGQLSRLIRGTARRTQLRKAGKGQGKRDTQQ